MRLTVPQSPKPAETEKREVMVYENKRGVLCVSATDLPWLLRHLYDESQGDSVPEPAEDDDEEEEWD
eukprot:2585999-Pyramimonas_sp.AAC.1